MQLYNQQHVSPLSHLSFYRAQPVAQPDGQTAGRAGRSALAGGARHLAQLLHHATCRRVQDAQTAGAPGQQQRHHRHRPGRDHHVRLAGTGRSETQPADADVSRTAQECQRQLPDRAVRAGKRGLGRSDDLRFGDSQAEFVVSRPARSHRQLAS